MTWLRKCVAIAVMTMVAPAPVQAEDDASDWPAAVPLEWDESWPRFRPWEYAYTAVVGATFFYFVLYVKKDFKVDLGGSNGFDEPVSDALRLPTRRQREDWGRASDYIHTYSQVHPFLVDGLIVPLLIHGNTDVTLQVNLMNLQAVWTVSLMSRVMHVWISRDRPLVEGCNNDPDYSAQCGSTGALASFPSGHALVTAAGAGMVCAHHRYLPLYGGGAADAAACYGLLGATAVMGVMRIMVDKHYLTDVIAGTAIGLVGGYGIPVALHYAAGDDGDDFSTSQSGAMIVPDGDADRIGLSLIGWF